MDLSFKRLWQVAHPSAACKLILSAPAKHHTGAQPNHSKCQDLIWFCHSYFRALAPYSSYHCHHWVQLGRQYFLCWYQQALHDLCMQSTEGSYAFKYKNICTEGCLWQMIFNKKELNNNPIVENLKKKKHPYIYQTWIIFSEFFCAFKEKI